MPFHTISHRPTRIDLYGHRCSDQLLQNAIIARTLAEAILRRYGHPTHTLEPYRLTDSALRAVQEDVSTLAAMPVTRMIEGCLGAAYRLDVESRGHYRDDGTFTYTADLMRSAFNTASIGAAFTLAATAVLAASYIPSTGSIRGWTSERDLVNWKLTERVAGVGVGKLKPIARGGRAELTSVEDAALENYRPTHFGGLVIADEMDIIDDRVGEILELVRDIGRQAGTLAGALVYSLLLGNPALAADAVALFHADHGNTATLTLDSTNLATAYAAACDQRIAGRPALVKPRYLVVPPALKFVAAGLVDALNRALEPDDRLIVRDDARLGPAGVEHPVTGELLTGSATTWFLAADAAVAPTIEVGYVNGRTPRLIETPLSNGEWGFGWSIDISVGACPLDYRGLYRGNT